MWCLLAVLTLLINPTHNHRVRGTDLVDVIAGRTAGSVLRPVEIVTEQWEGGVMVLASTDQHCLFDCDVLVSACCCVSVIH